MYENILDNVHISGRKKILQFWLKIFLKQIASVVKYQIYVHMNEKYLYTLWFEVQVHLILVI